MARRPKAADVDGGKGKGKRQAPPPSNVTDETILEFWAKLTDKRAKADAARKDWQTAEGEYKAAKKAAKSSGIDIDAMGELLAMRNVEIVDVDRRHRNVARYAKVVGVPLQYLLFEGESVSSQVDQAKIAEGQGAGIPSVGDLADAQSAGEAAGMAGRGASTNPHDPGLPAGTPETPLGMRWHEGWLEGQARLAGASTVTTAAPGEGAEAAA